MTPMRFGTFLAPIHAQIGEDLTSSYERDLDVLRLLDKLGFDEAWIGEHHTGGAEPIPDPALFIAHAANHTRHIRLGTGVVSLPYHNPLWVADSMLFLDHLTRGRMMMGVGSGAFPTDAGMIGLGPLEQRGALEEDIDVLMHLLRSDEPISVKTPRYELVEARCQLSPFTYPVFETAVTAVVSPNGPSIAGKHDMGMISVAASSAAGFDVLASHWQVFAEQSVAFGHEPDRSRWRLVAPMHLSTSKRQAIEDVAFGLTKFQDYFVDVLHGSILRAEGRTHAELVDWINDTGFGVIGTPDDAVEMIERLVDQSGGFGTFLLFHHEWATPAATQQHYELFARFVKPRFQHRTQRLIDSAAWCRSVTGELRTQVTAAQQAAIRLHAERRAQAQAQNDGG